MPTHTYTIMFPKKKTEHATATWQIDGFNQQLQQQQWQPSTRKPKKYKKILEYLYHQKCNVSSLMCKVEDIKWRIEKKKTTKTAASTHSYFMVVGSQTKN